MRRDRLTLYLVLGLFLLPTSAHAAGLMATIQNMLSQYIPASDESISMLRQVFGDFVLNPFTQSGTGSGLLAQMFGQFNLFIFAVALIWFSYTAISGLLHTMHEGVLFGQRMSTVWVPIRVGFGAVSLVPAFGGWALCQALIMTAATLGIAGANAITQTAINSAAGFGVLVNGSGSIKSSAQLVDVESKLLNFMACTRSVNDMNREGQALGLASGATSLGVTLQRTATTLAWAFPSNSGPTGCGTIQETFSPRGVNTGVVSSIASTFGFQIAGVDYSAIREAAMTAHEQAMGELIQRANRIIVGVGDSEAGSPAYAAAVQQIHDGYQGVYPQLVDANLASLAASGNARTSAVTDQLRQNMLAGGWATLGTWYSSFAEVNEAMNEMVDPTIDATAGKELQNSRHVDLMDGIAAANKQATDTTGITTATGNVSIGQWLMRGAIGGAVGASSTGNSQMINPIIAFKNLGDNTIVLAETIYTVVKVVQTTPIGAAISGAIGPGGAFSGLVKKTGPLAFLTSIASDFGQFLVPIGMILLGTAAVMAFYLPMIPFVTWFAALINWFTSIIEGLIGSSLWALAHFDADGEGMGQRASYGYLYLFNAFARPIVLVFGFFVASAGVNVLGTFLFKYFGQAVANAQGSSLTGLISIIAYLVIFVILGMMLISSIFNASLHMADRVIGFVGTGIQSSIGQDVENRVNGIFINASRSGIGAITPRPKAGESKAPGLEGAVKAATLPAAAA